MYDADKAGKAHAGSAGVDKETSAACATNLKGNLDKIWNPMASGRSAPPPVKALASPKTKGGARMRGVPSMADRGAQRGGKIIRQPSSLEPHVRPDSYGVRPGTSARAAVDVARKRCGQQDGVLEVAIKGLFDKSDRARRRRRLETPTDWAGIRRSIGRWRTAPLQRADGTRGDRPRGTPQGGGVGPLLANLFRH